MARTRGGATNATTGRNRGASVTKTPNKGRQGRANVIDSRFAVPTGNLPGGGSTLTQSQVYRMDRASAFGGGSATNQS